MLAAYQDNVNQPIAVPTPSPAPKTVVPVPVLSSYPNLGKLETVSVLKVDDLIPIRSYAAILWVRDNDPTLTREPSSRSRRRVC
jgi:hypothetical protein